MPKVAALLICALASLPMFGQNGKVFAYPGIGLKGVTRLGVLVEVTTPNGDRPGLDSRIQRRMENGLRQAGFTIIPYDIALSKAVFRIIYIESSEEIVDQTLFNGQVLTSSKKESWYSTQLTYSNFLPIPPHGTNPASPLSVKLDDSNSMKLGHCKKNELESYLDADLDNAVSWFLTRYKEAQAIIY